MRDRGIPDFAWVSRGGWKHLQEMVTPRSHSPFLAEMQGKGSASFGHGSVLRGFKDLGWTFKSEVICLYLKKAEIRFCVRRLRLLLTKYDRLDPGTIWSLSREGSLGHCMLI